MMLELAILLNVPTSSCFPADALQECPNSDASRARLSFAMVVGRQRVLASSEIAECVQCVWFIMM